MRVGPGRGLNVNRHYLCYREAARLGDAALPFLTEEEERKGKETKVTLRYVTLQYGTPYRVTVRYVTLSL